jgi:Na+/melibiose symporter-like transporter
MSNSATAELIFIAAMMILILIMSVVATYLFFRQYNLEKKNKEKINEQARKQAKEYVEK